MRFVVRVAVNAFAIWIVTLLPALQVQLIPFAPGEWFQVLLTLLVVGLISLIINGFLLWLTGVITENGDWGLRTGEFWLTVVAALLIGIINAVLGGILRPRREERERR